jgi:nucleolar protein 4
MQAGRMRGFAFVQFGRRAAADAAIKALNGTEIDGRRVAVDFAVAKDRFEAAKPAPAAAAAAAESESEPESESESESEAASEAESEAESEAGSERGSEGSGDESNLSDMTDEDDDDDEEEEEEEESDRAADAGELVRTVFVRNVPTDATPHDLRAAFAGFGRIAGAYLVRDPVTGHARGTAFVQYADPAAAAAAIEAGSAPVSAGARTGAGVSALDRMAGSIAVCGRRVVVAPALARQSARELSAPERRKAERGTDRRNMYLADEGCACTR